MGDALQYVFGYGSLARRGVGAAGPPARAARLREHRRVWNVAMDNTLDLPGYKHYLDAADGSRPDVFVTFLNLVAAPGRAVNGVAFAVDERELGELDRRERNYARVEVGALLERAIDAPVWAYLGTLDAEARFAAAIATGTAVVDARYRDGVRDGFALLGEQALAEFDAGTEAPACPIVALERIDLR